MTDELNTITGGCICGGVRYSIGSAPLAVIACHCTSCRKQSGAAHSVNLIVRASTMTVKGDLSRFEDPDTASGAPIEREFCGSCGSPIRSVPSAKPKIIAVKAGTLDEPAAYAPTMHIWMRSALPWVILPEGMPRYETEPQA